jgi:hypothetical protein
MPLRRSTTGFIGRTVTGRRMEVMIATRPPGARTRRISSIASKGSANRWRAAKQQTQSKLESSKGSAVASPLISARLSMPAFCVS